MSPKPVHRVPGSMKRRQQEVAPQLASYSRLANVLWPLVTVTSPPNEAGTVVSTDSRGHRVTRMGDRTIRSDAAPEDAAFLLGGSFVFGVGASSDAGTLASALSMRTGVPYVNLGVRAAGSMQELVTALPFAERWTVFVVCSGVNNMIRSGKSGFDPLFGALVCDPYFETLSTLPVRDISRRLKDPLLFVQTRALTEELRRRLRTRVTRRPAPRPRPAAKGPKREKSAREVDPEVGCAAPVARPAGAPPARTRRGARRFRAAAVHAADRQGVVGGGGGALLAARRDPGQEVDQAPRRPVHRMGRVRGDDRRGLPRARRAVPRPVEGGIHGVGRSSTACTPPTAVIARPRNCSPRLSPSRSSSGRRPRSLRPRWTEPAWAEPDEDDQDDQDDLYRLS